MEKKYIEAEHFKERVMKAADELNDAAMYNVAKAICEMVDWEDAAEVVAVEKCKECKRFTEKAIR